MVRRSDSRWVTQLSKLKSNPESSKSHQDMALTELSKRIIKTMKWASQSGLGKWVVIGFGNNWRGGPCEGGFWKGSREKWKVEGFVGFPERSTGRERREKRLRKWSRKRRRESRRRSHFSRVFERFLGVWHAYPHGSRLIFCL